MEGVDGRTAPELDLICTLFGKAVRIHLRLTGHTDRLCLHTVDKNCKIGRSLVTVIDHKIKGKLLILPHFQRRRQMIIGKDATVRKNEFRADEGGVGHALVDVQVNTFGTDGQVLLLHFSDHLDGMSPGGKTGRKDKVAVGRSGPGNGSRIRLYTVNIQGDNLLTGTGKGIGDADYVGTAIARHAGGQVIARSQGKGDNLDTRKGLFGLCLARFRIGRAGFHEYVSGPEHKILA